MLTKKMKKNWEENKRAYIAAGLLIGFGVVLGARAQRKLDMQLLAKNLEGVAVLKKAVDPMFPAGMSISDIKEVLGKIEGATFFDALVTNVNGTQSLIIR